MKAREHHSKTEEQYKLEIASQNKLVLLYKVKNILLSTIQLMVNFQAFS